MTFSQSPYHDPITGKMTPAMIRARRPFFKGNMIGLSLLVGVTGGIYYYTYNFLHKDNDFNDVPIPPLSEEQIKQLKEEYENKKL